MTTDLARRIASICSDRRAELGTSQTAVAEALGISRSHYAAIEHARANPSIRLVERIGQVLGVRLELQSTPIIVIPSARIRDSLHACCSGYVARRLAAAGWDVRREVLIQDGRLRGWIDLLAYDPRTRTVLIIEIKTALDDIGGVERQVGWYERTVATAIPDEWQASRIGSWVLLLATAEADEAVARHRVPLGQAFPARATTMRGLLDGGTPHRIERGLALVDPRSRRRDWLVAARTDGRRTPIPYQDRVGAMRVLGL